MTIPENYHLYKGRNRFLRRLLSTDSLMVGLLLALCIYYGYQNLILLEPQSLHKWRQSDSASFTWNYFYSTMNLFEPEMNSRLGSHGKVASEFPLINYLAGMLARVLGYGPWIHRSLNIAVVLAGLFALYRSILFLLKDRFWAIVIPMLVFTSPVLVFFTNGFIPDPPAFGFCLIGWYFLIRYQKRLKEKDFWLSWSFFTLAGLIKISFGISIVALFLIWAAERMGKFFPRISLNASPIFHKNRLPYFAFFTCMVAIWVAWYMYASWYSTGFKSDHFANIILPIYRLPQDEIYFILLDLFKVNFHFLYHPSVHYLLWGLFLLGLFRVGQPDFTAWGLTILMVIGGGIYLSIFFKLIGGHQYYHTVNLIPVCAVFIYGAFLATRYILRPRPKQLLYAAVIAFLCMNIYHAKMEMQRRYYGNVLHDRENQYFYDPGLNDFLNELGVTSEKFVISIPDKSPNNTLYLLKRKGWSEGQIHPPYGPSIKIVVTNEDPDYLIINDTSILSVPELQPYLNDFKGQFGDILVYKIGK